MSAAVAINLVSPLTLSGASTHFGQRFVEGDVPAGQYIQVDPADAANFAVTAHNYWPDGSLRGARITLRANFVAGVPKRINLVKRSSPGAAGTALTAADILAGPSLVVSCGSYGSIALSAMTLLRTYVSNKECVTAIFAGRVGSDPLLWVEVAATRYADGNSSFDLLIHSSFAGSTAYSNKTYTPSISVGGVVKFNNGGTAFVHYPHASLRTKVWSGTDPQIRPVHDTGYLLEAVVGPNTSGVSTASSLLSGLTALGSYTSGANLGYTPNFGDTGYQPPIGPMSSWDNQYFITKGSAEGYGAVQAHAGALHSYGTTFADAATFDPINYTNQATWGIDGLGNASWAGYGGGGAPATKTQDGATNLSYDTPHAPLPSAYLAYCLNDSYLDFVSLVHICRLSWLSLGNASGSGVNRRFGGQMRQRAWDTRTLGVTCSVMPDSLVNVFGDLKTHLKNCMIADAAYYTGIANPGGQFGLVDLPIYDEWYPGGYAETPAFAGIAPWQLDFYANVLGWLRKLKPLDSAGMTALTSFHNYIIRGQLARIGTPGDATQYNPGGAAIYFLKYRSTKTQDGGNLPSQVTTTNPGQLYQDNFGVVNPSGITLVGSSGADPSSATNYWPQFISTFAWMKDLGISGADTKLALLKTATNWSATQGATDKLTYPNFNIVARSEYSQPRLYTATDSGSGEIVPTPGPSFAWDVAPMFANSFVWDKFRGLGVPLSTIASGGSDGTSPLYDAIVAAAGAVSAASEVRYIPDVGSHGTVTTGIDGSVIYSGDGSYDTVPFDYYLDGPLLQSAVPMNFGTPPAGSTITGLTVTPTAVTQSFGTIQFAPVLTGTGSFSPLLNRTATLGSINASNLYTLPLQTSVVQYATITWVSAQDNSFTATAVVTIPAYDPSATLTATVQFHKMRRSKLKIVKFA